ncbi:neutral alpha-glucosidase AB-like isoform X2 [Limulus polyphemus]|uniref:Glucosidase II subunit alpha n=1 Tax=Limulus polyphemus TaxID=6850 RepID=A0ABM1B345_LIMPO|nr:neutral alpha-glucosidase AB-like isoform X2 [Limulus polyphemus]
MKMLLLLSVLTTLSLVVGVDRGNFKSCDQSGFCRRNRNMQPGESPYYLLMNNLKVSPTKIESRLANAKTGVLYTLEISALMDGMLRMKINEATPIRQRFEATEALNGEPKETSLKLVSQNSEGMTIEFGKNKAIIHANPFRLDVYSGDQHVISANTRGLMKFEHYRTKEQPKPENQEQEGPANQVEEEKPAAEVEDMDGAWEEHFKSHADSKPFGPSSVGMDFSFVGFKHVYGIPEHADAFSLKQTKGSTDPYRLYNLDVFQFEVNNPMALYGSVPFMVAHSDIKTVGLLWLNAAETWIDIEPATQQGSTQLPQTDTHWFSESGIIDVFFLPGPGPKDVMKQNAILSGTTPLPPYFSIAYHQCRWNYNDQEDVRNVDANFDEHDIPYDVIWLDIEHTDGKKYFTWDNHKFPNPEEMINNVTAKGRKMVTIIDPHIKRDSGYHIHSEATSKGYYVKNKDGHDYDGWCWPGSSGYLDFVNPEVRDWWASKFGLDHYKGSTLQLFTWNDMNEPSVFNGPEVTMHKDAKHYGSWEHRDLHNMYGILMTMSTYKGHLQRSNGHLRSFLLSRAFFVGSQRYGAVWTGDNTADWDHLRITVPMLLSMSISGITFCGADVGGFFMNPDAELLVRWYQAGAFQPFFRAHSHLETKRREPWLFDAETKQLIRAAIQKRYSLLPYWYTLFMENEQNGMPPMRPLWMEFPSDQTTFDMDDEYMIGSSLLVHPVMESKATNVEVYFPGENQVWYDVDNYQKFNGLESSTIPVTMSKIPVFQRGGTIIAKRERMRRSSSLSHDDPYTLIVALDKTGQFANGNLYIDDGHTFQYKQGEYIYQGFSFKKDTLTNHALQGSEKFETKAWLEKVIIIGISTEPKTVQVESHDFGKKNLLFTYKSSTQLLIIRKPAVNIEAEWSIKLLF